MPILDGFEATERILRMDPSSNILALTAYCSESVKKKCIELGMKEVLNKPVTVAKLDQIMELYFN